MDIKILALICVTLLTGVALLGIFLKMKSGFGPFNLKVYGITLIIGITAIIVFTNSTAEQTAPVYGILGAIAGYLFGLKKEKN